MNYPQSKHILEEINKAKNILVNCHRGPDLDSVGSALSMSYVLKNLDKNVTVICPSEKIYEDLDFLKGYDNILKKVRFNNFGFDKYDLFLSLDSSTWSMVSGVEGLKIPDIKIIAIDHHHTNDKYGNINLVDESRSSVAELLYLVYEDWEVKVDKDISTALLTGIIGDTGIFKYPNTTIKTFEIAYKLMEIGADKNIIIDKAYRNYDFDLIKFWGEALDLAKVDNKYNFVYSFIPYKVFEKWGKPDNAKEMAADLFSQSTKGTDFGIVGLEREPGNLSLSLRARNDFDTSVIAKELNGGGHKAASGGKVEGIDFEKAVQKVLRVARKYAKANN